MAIERIKRDIPPAATCVAIVADRGERYLDTIYSDEWVHQHFGDISHLWADSTESHTGVMATY
jgi:cysteine synthase A